MSENNKVTFVIVAPNNYDVKKYSLGVHNNFPKNLTIISYEVSKIEFEFDQKDENGNFVAIVEYPFEKLLTNPRITLFNGTIEESKNYKPKNIFNDDKHLPFVYSDNNKSDSDNNKSQIFKIELCKSHETTLQKVLEGGLHYEYLTKEQLNEYKEKFLKNESNIEEEEEQNHENNEAAKNNENDDAAENHENDDATKIDDEAIENDENDDATKIDDEAIENDENNDAIENDKILLSIDSEIENANAFLLNGKFHLINDKYDKIFLDKNKKYKIEVVYYDEKKGRFYYFPETNVCEFDTFDIDILSFSLKIYKNFFAPSRYIQLNSKPINHEKSSNLELGFGIPLALAAIGFAFALAFGGLPAIIALPFIIVFGVLGGGLITKGSFDKHSTLKKPKEDKSQKSETKYFDELNPTFNQSIDNPVWVCPQTINVNYNETDQPQIDNDYYFPNFDDPFDNPCEEDQPDI